MKLVNKKNAILIGICVALIIGLLIYGLFGNKEKNPMNNYISYGLVAKDVSLIFNSKDQCLESTDTYFNEKIDDWYVPFMNTMYEMQFFTTKDVPATEAGANELFTYDDLDSMFTNMGITQKELLAFVKNNKASGKITYNQWVDIMEALVTQLDTENNIKSQSVSIVGTPSNVKTMSKWTTATSNGIYSFSGLAMDYYIDKQIQVYTRDDEILFVTKVLSEDVVYDNAWIITVDSGNVKAYIGGIIRDFIITDKASSYSNVVADIVLKDKKLTDFKVKSSVVTGKVLSSSSNGIEIEGQGVIPIADNIKIYKTFGALSTGSIKDILVGYDLGQYFIEDGKVAAAVLDRDVDAQNIRVLIMNNGYSSIYHDNVVLSSSNGLTVTVGENKYDIPANEKVNLNLSSEWLAGNRVKLEAAGINGKITIDSLTRGYGAPSYRGSIELNLYDGKLVIINELPVEKYLLCVVPSEMPYTYNIEALKAQAVCARSYAYQQVRGNSYSAYGAHVDDSTNYQVYNNASEQEASTFAVEETYGRVITYNKEVITAYFFSTSCGSTTDSSVWGIKQPYTEGKVLTSKDTEMDLSNEETFDAFIRVSYDSIDSEYPWYRWNAALSLEDLSDIVNSHLEQLCSTSPNNVFVLKDSGQYTNEYVSGIGKIKKISVNKRGQGGVVESVVINGSEKTIMVTKELNIRKLFNTNGYTITRLNGSDVTDFPLLPSAYVIFDPILKDNLLSGYNIIGGGYGHGVGLSQNGANYLGKNGSSYDEILKYFYKDVEITKLY